MKKVLIIITLLISSTISSQSKRIAIETMTYETSNDDYRKISYERSLDVRYDDDWGKFYNTLYLFYNKQGSKIFEVAISNYERKDFIRVYFMPFDDGEIVKDKITGYNVEKSEFIRKKYSRNLEGNLTNRKELKISYISDKKEHLYLQEIVYKPYRVHYKLNN